jgi:hypothetical protein
VILCPAKEWNPGSGNTQFDRPLLTDVSHVETVTHDIEGRALACTDARGNTVYSATYSVSALPLATRDARDGGDAIIETVREWTLYGERATDAADDNRLGTAWRAFDAAGMVESNGFLRPSQPSPNTRDTLDFLGDSCLADAAFRHSHGQGVESRRTVFQGITVQAQEDLRSEQTSSLVAVNERMVRDDVKQVSCRHLKEPSVYVRPSEGCLRLRNCRL